MTLSPNIGNMPKVAIANPTLFTRDEIAAFEKEILCNPKATEPEASQFFSRIPKFLFLGQGCELKREVPLYSSDGRTVGRVDFFRRSYGRRDWDLIELKSPQYETVVAKHTNRPRLPAAIHGGVGQLLDYKRWIQVDCELRARLLREEDVFVYHPQLLLVVGREPQDVPWEVVDHLYEIVRNQGVAIYSYDDIFRFATEFYEETRFLVLFAQTGTSRNEVSRDVVHLSRSQEPPGEGRCTCGGWMEHVGRGRGDHRILKCRECGTTDWVY